MDRNKGTENLIRKKENRESKLPKSTKSCQKDTCSKNLKEKTQNLKEIAQVDTITSKGKQTQTTSRPKNVRPMSLATISKDVMDHFQTENLKLEDLPTECADRITVQNKGRTFKRAPLKEKYSQTLKQPERLPKKPSTSNLKPSAGFGGMRLNLQKNSCQSDVFQKKANETKKDYQVINPPALSKETAVPTKELKTTNSAKVVLGKEMERSNEENLENHRTDDAKSSKATSLSMKESVLKNCEKFGGLSFTPKWQSTPLKPDFFDIVKKESKRNKDITATDSSTKWLIDTPDSAKVIVREKTATATTTAPVDETAQLTTKEGNFFKTASIISKEANYDAYTAFQGIRLIPKRKSTLPLHDIFETEPKESKTDDQELQNSGLSAEKMKMSSTKTAMKTEIHRSNFKKLDHFSIEKTRSSETVSVTTKKTRRITTFGGKHLATKPKRTSIKPNIYVNIQKKSKTDDQESNPTGSSTNEFKKPPDSSKAIIKEDNLQAPTAEKPESSEKITEKNVNEVIPKPFPAFGGLSCMPKERNLRDIFEARKANANNQEQS